MKRLLIPLLAALALPSSVSAEYYVNEDLMTDEIIHRVIFDSITKTSNSIGIMEEAQIFIRCKVKDNDFKSIDAGIITPNYLADNRRVALRWNTATPVERRWIKSTNSKSLFSNEPEIFINKLNSFDNLVVQWTPYSSHARAVKFELNNEKKDIKKLKEVGCIF